MTSIEDKGRLPRKEYFSTFTYDFFLAFLAALVIALMLVTAGVLIYKNAPGVLGSALFISGALLLAVFLPLSFFLFGERLIITGKALRLVRKNIEVTILFGKIKELTTPPPLFGVFRSAIISDGESRITISGLKYPEYDEIINLVKVGRKQASAPPGGARREGAPAVSNEG
jgi:hypothetical protein